MRKRAKSNKYYEELKNAVTDCEVIDCLKKFHFFNEIFVKLSLIDLNDKEREFKQDVLNLVSYCFTSSFYMITAAKMLRERNIGAEAFYRQVKNEMSDFLKSKLFSSVLTSHDFFMAEVFFEIVKQDIINPLRSGMFDEYSFISDSIDNIRTAENPDDNVYIEEAFKCYQHVKIFS